MKSIRLIRILVLNYFVLLVCVFNLSSVKGFGEGGTGSHTTGPNRAGRPSGDQGAIENSSSYDGYLFGANKNNNPGFPYVVHAGGGFFDRCQATLISTKNGRCIAATAAHCLRERASEQRKNECPNSGKEFGFERGQATIETADFGRVKATVFINPEHQGGTKSEDSAVFSWECPDGNKNVPVIPLSKKPLSENEAVFYGKVMAGKEGLYGGSVWREPGISKVNKRIVGEAADSIMSNDPSKKIQEGDSGGGAYRKLADGTLELVGVLSTGDSVDRNLPLGTYATNKSLDFIRCVSAMLGGDTSSNRIASESRADETKSSNKPNDAVADHQPPKHDNPQPKVAAGPIAPQPSEKDSTAEQNPAQQHCEGGVCKVGPKPVEPQQAGLTPDFFGQPQTQVSQSPEVKPEGKTENFRPEFEVDGYTFGKDPNGALVRIGANGEKKVARLQEGLNGNRHLVFDASGSGGNSYDSASKAEREALRKYYLEIKGDEKSWAKMSKDQRDLINGFVNNSVYWPKSAEATVAPTEPKKAEQPQKAESTPEHYRDILGARGISEVGTLSKDPSKTSFSKNGLRVDWMKDDLTGKSYRFVTNERTGQTILSSSSVETPEKKTSPPRDFQKELTRAAGFIGTFGAKALQRLQPLVSSPAGMQSTPPAAQKQNRNPALKYLELDQWLKPGDKITDGNQTITVGKAAIRKGLAGRGLAGDTIQYFVIPTSEGWRLVGVSLNGTGVETKVRITIDKYDPKN